MSRVFTKKRLARTKRERLGGVPRGLRNLSPSLRIASRPEVKEGVEGTLPRKGRGDRRIKEGKRLNRNKKSKNQ